ncbi:hypothetical protein DYBT9275_01656 [Dyadobacter sp. CECT 9275]|uniref:Uncharacterized protein n=1 Tax=Dyadobacter helix TaxID=2822344 RepID=A0A916JAN5_9BACT|nr:hypothetical protein DYBT9275_01656 [Dyadobacter sp. CECT 9275]
MGKNGQKLMTQVHFANAYFTNISLLDLTVEFVNVIKNCLTRPNLIGI